MEDCVTEAKKTYALALQNLEAISDEIHRQRREASLRREMGVRGSGVGAESPSPPPHVEQASMDTQSSCSKRHSMEVEVRDDSAKVRLRPRSNHSESEVGQEQSQLSPSQLQEDFVLYLQKEGDKFFVKNDMLPSARPGGSSRPTAITFQVADHDPLGATGRTTPNNITGVERRDVMVYSEPGVSNPSDRQSVQGAPHGGHTTVAKRVDISSSVIRSSSQGSLRTVPSALQHKSATVDELLQGQGNVSVQKPRPLSERPPYVRVTAVSPTARSSTPVSPTESSEMEFKGISEQTRQTNEEIMASLQRAKGLGSATSSRTSMSSRPFLRPNPRSRDDLLDDGDTESISGSFASASMLDDDQIESLMMETGEYSRFLEQLDEREAKKWKRRSLPAKLGYLEGHMTFDPVWLDPEGKNKEGQSKS